MLTRFWHNRSGNVGMIFGLMAVPLVMFSGAALDLDLVFTDRSRAQNALDRATLAAAADLGLLNATQVEANLRTNYATYFKPADGTTTKLNSIEINTDTGEVTASAEVVTKMNFMRLGGIVDMTSNFSTTVKLGINDYDVALVLDNSGSMAGSKINTLKTAAKDLVTTLLAMNSTTSRNDLVQIGVVPFAASVNIGTQWGPTYNGATRTSDGPAGSWLDINGISTVSRENFNAGLTDSRFDLFASLAASRPADAGVLRWGGCVETRPYPYDVKDTTASVATPDTLIVPMFAPDEPGYYSGSSWTNPSGFGNNYLDDNSGLCTTNASNSNNTTRLEAQGRTCKYKEGSGKTIRWRITPTQALGPNASCTTKPILAMTRDETSLKNHIDSLAANGNTNIHEGVMWGWRVLSPKEPFTEGRTPTTARPLRKIMIVMTDGENTYTTSSNVNQSTYAAYGYIAENRLGVSTNNATAIKTAQDTRTLQACTNAKADDQIVIYTIGFTVTAEATLTMLKNCATSAAHFYKAEDNNMLLEAFQQIAKDITQLRVAK
jgi:Flp pilus assembly protein TadG